MRQTAHGDVKRKVGKLTVEIQKEKKKKSEKIILLIRICLPITETVQLKYKGKTLFLSKRDRVLGTWNGI